MIYDITKPTPPERPRYGKGLEFFKKLATQLSAGMDDVVIPTIFPTLAEYVCGAEFKHPSNVWMELCGMMSQIISPSGMNKGEMTNLIEALARKLRVHDEAEMQRIVEWSKAVQAKGANKDKPVRPDAALYFPPANTTAPALLGNAMALELDGNHCQYFNLPEVEMADRMCGGHKQVSEMMRNFNDRVRDGAMRATANGITGNPIFRVNITMSSTPYAARKFYRNELFNGTLGRIHTFYKPRNGRSGKIPRQGEYNETFLANVDNQLKRLEECHGRFVIPQLNKLADRLAADMADFADLMDDDIVWDMGKRAIQYAWKCGCVMWVLNEQQWTRAMGEWVEYICALDIWSKTRIFGDMLKGGDTGTREAAKCGPRNMLDDLPESFGEVQLEALRATMDKPKEGTGEQLRQWLHRKFITYSAQTGLYTKTEEYLKKHPQPANR